MVLNIFNRQGAEKSYPDISGKIDNFLGLPIANDQDLNTINFDDRYDEIQKLFSGQPLEFVKFAADVMSSNAFEKNDLYRAAAILLVAETYGCQRTDYDILADIHLGLAKIFKAAGQFEKAQAHAKETYLSGCSGIKARSQSFMNELTLTA